jgi:hypothetical protein
MAAVPPANPWTKMTSIVALNLGLGSAVGELGLTYALALLPSWECELGAGVGRTGKQFSIMQKAVIGRGQTRFLTGIGLAYSPAQGPSYELPSSHWWLNLDLLGLEHRAPNHFLFSFAFGFSCQLDESPAFLGGNGRAFPQIRFLLGSWI